MTEDEQNIYFCEYLNARNVVQGRQDMTLTEEEVELLRLQTRIIYILYLFNYHVFALVSVDQQLKDLNFMEFVSNQTRVYKGPCRVTTSSRPLSISSKANGRKVT